MLSFLFQKLFNFLAKLALWFFEAFIKVLAEWVNKQVAWFNEQLVTWASGIINYLMSFLPPDQQESYREGIEFIHGFWVIADSFVPLTETFAFVLMYISIYAAIKLTLFIIRLIIGFIDIVGGLGFP